MFPKTLVLNNIQLKLKEKGENHSNYYDFTDLDLSQFYLVVIQTIKRSDNKLRGVRKFLLRYNKVTDKVYLIPKTDWTRVKRILPRSEIIIYYSDNFSQLIKPKDNISEL